MKKTLIIGLSTSQGIASKAAERADFDYIDANVQTFADGEKYVELSQSVRGRNVVVVQSTHNPVNDNIMELLIVLDSLKRSSVCKVTIVIPYYGYSRQDRKTASRPPITAKLIADLISVAGADRLVTFDLHSPQSEGFFDMPVDNIKAMTYIAQTLKSRDLSNLTIVSPDHGGTNRAKAVADTLNLPLAVIDKRREKANVAEANFILGDVKGRNVLIVDDMVDTAGTISTAIKLLKTNGALDVSVSATHAVLSANEDEKYALNRMKKAGVKEFITTNTIVKTYEDDILTVVDLSNLLGDILKTNANGESLAKFFEKE